MKAKSGADDERKKTDDGKKKRETTEKSDKTLKSATESVSMCSDHSLKFKIIPFISDSFKYSVSCVSIFREGSVVVLRAHLLPAREEKTRQTASSATQTMNGRMRNSKYGILMRQKRPTTRKLDVSNDN